MHSLKIAYDPVYAHPLPEGHRFPMLKYELIPGQLIREGTISERSLFSPSPCPDEVLLRTHSASYLQKLKSGGLTEQEERRIGFPKSAQLVEREIRIVQGTIDCALYALEYGVALNVAGGTHHAFADRGEGFCLLNDFAVAANELLYRGLAQRIIIIDLDVHQGNGTAAIFEDNPKVFTFSMHGAHNYPFHKERSSLDVPLRDGTDDFLYLSLLRKHLDLVFDSFQPDFAFYLSGVDVLSSDKFGKLKLTMEGCRKRDEIVFSSLQQRGIACAVAMGGGYSPDLRTIVEAHCNTFRTAKEVYQIA